MGGGGHGLATAYYLAKEHGLTNVAVLEKGWLGGGNTGRNTVRGPGDFNVDLSLIKNTKIGAMQTEARIEAFNILNHPQFANPNGQLGNSAFGTISAMLASPSCALCGTTERQVQVAVKMKF